MSAELGIGSNGLSVLISNYRDSQWHGVSIRVGPSTPYSAVGREGHRTHINLSLLTVDEQKEIYFREGIINMIMFGLLTFPSNEFDLKNIAATVVPTLVDPKRRVRQASLGKESKK